MKIYTVFNCDNKKTSYYCVVNDEAKRISKTKWFNIYDKSDTIVLPPLTVNK